MDICFKENEIIRNIYFCTENNEIDDLFSSYGVNDY